jgi:trehalose 6-phosphate phosphatase
LLECRASNVTRLDTAVQLAIDTLRQRPSALISDIDGTLSRIVSRPEDAVVSDRARHALRGLAQRLDRVALITARQEAVARSMVGLDELTYMGSYALDAASTVRLRQSDIVLIKERGRAILEAFSGAMLEEKDISVAFHYRNCAAPEQTRLRLLDLLVPLAQAAGGRIVEGKRVIEIVPAALPDKDVAFAKLAADQALRGVIFMGDDGADSAVFRAIRRRREQGYDGLAVAVIDAETPPSVIEAADVALAGVSEVEDFLDALLAAIGLAPEWR